MTGTAAVDRKHGRTTLTLLRPICPFSEDDRSVVLCERAQDLQRSVASLSFSVQPQLPRNFAAVISFQNAASQAAPGRMSQREQNRGSRQVLSV